MRRPRRTAAGGWYTETRDPHVHHHESSYCLIFLEGGGTSLFFVVVVEQTLHEERPPLFSTLFSVFFQISKEGGEGHFFFEPAVGLSVNERTCERAG